MAAKKLLPAAACAALLVLGAQAQQRQGARAGTPPQGAGQSQAQHAQQGQAREAAAHRAGPARGSAQWRTMRHGAAQEMVRAEHEYRWRLARIERMREVYRQMGRTDRLAELDRLQTRAQDRYRDRTNDCQLDLGDRDYDRLRQRIHDQDLLHDRDRDRDRIHQNP